MFPETTIFENRAWLNAGCWSRPRLGAGRRCERGTAVTAVLISTDERGWVKDLHRSLPI